LAGSRWSSVCSTRRPQRSDDHRVPGSNNSGLLDNHNHHSDWIELYNPQVSNFALSGYYLTDNSTNLTGWQFPQGTIMTGGSYMLVFASGDNEAVVGQPFHTDFQLNSNGGYLGLVAPDGVFGTFRL